MKIIKRSVITKITFENKTELLQSLRGCFHYPYNQSVPTAMQIEFIRAKFREHLSNVGGYQIVSNGYGQMKEIKFDNLTNPMNAAYMFVGIAAKLTYPLTVEF